MITQWNKEAKTARQLTANEAPLLRENCVRNVNQNWADDFLNLYDSADKYENRGDAIIQKLGEWHDEKTALELKFLLDHVDKKVRQDFVNNFLKPEVLIEKPSLKIEVKWIGHTDVRKKSNGRARLYLSKNGKEEQVHFKRRASFILYLIFLLEVCQTEGTGMLDITKSEKQFCKLFKEVYAYDGGMPQFKTLFGKGNSEQELLRHCLSDIRKNIGDTCGLLNVEATPYILSNKQSHLSVQKQNIVIDERLLKAASTTSSQSTK